MDEQFIEVEAASLEEARRQLNSQIPENLTVLKEQILSFGNLQTVEVIGDTIEEAFNEAKGKIPAGATIETQKTITAPERKIFQLKGLDENSALKTISIPPHLNKIESLTLNKQGRKGFLGFGKTPNIYDLTVNKKAKVSISFRENFKIRAKIGIPPCCQRCEKEVLRHSQFRHECGKAGLLLIDGNLYGDSNDRAKVEIYRDLENRKGFRCASCSNIYCMSCLFDFAPASSNGGKACFECRGSFERFE